LKILKGWSVTSRMDLQFDLIQDRPGINEHRVDMPENGPVDCKHYWKHK